jgi:hypothetical protein
MRKSFIFFISLFLPLSLWSCESTKYIKSEIDGTAKPPGGIQEVVPAKKKYPVGNEKLRLAVIEQLDEEGYIYDENPSTGTIKTEPNQIKEPRQFGFVGAMYYAKLIIKLSGSTIDFRARFNKDSNLTQDEQNLEYPEKENELRKNFFAALDKKLAVESSYGDFSKREQSSPSQKIDVHSVQTRLTELGYNPGPIDGLMGKRTSNAIKKFQEDNGLSVTGKIDADTINKLGM